MLFRSLSCLVGLAVISFTTRLSVEFVNNLAAVLNVLASQVATALDTLNNEEITSSSGSSVPDGAWREPSPPPSYDPNFDWNESD